jgi:hypothetical protein
MDDGDRLPIYFVSFPPGKSSNFVGCDLKDLGFPTWLLHHRHQSIPIDDPQTPPGM